MEDIVVRLFYCMKEIFTAKDLGKIIQERRKEKKLTQKAVSDVTGLSTSFISDVENGKETIEFSKVLILLKILSMDLVIKNRGE